MNPPRVYADFNSLEHHDSQSVASVGLTGYGTLASLSKLKLQLHEGMALLLYEPNDIEVEAVAYFDSTREDPAGRAGEWMARVDPNQFRDCTETEGKAQEHLCFSCGRNIYSHLRQVGQQYKELCPSCGTSVMAPLAPPHDAT